MHVCTPHAHPPRALDTDATTVPTTSQIIEGEGGGGATLRYHSTTLQRTLLTEDKVGYSIYKDTELPMHAQGTAYIKILPMHARGTAYIKILPMHARGTAYIKILPMHAHRALRLRDYHLINPLIKTTLSCSNLSK